MTSAPLKSQARGWGLATLLLASTQGVTLAAGEPASKPNIVYILADDLGYGDVSCYNARSKISTPNLDRLAAEGTRFTDAHASSSVCTATRYALLTGRYGWRSRLKHGVLEPWDKPLIAADRLTVPALLRQHGYTTACIGKWHLGWVWPTKDGNSPNTGADYLSNVDFTKPVTEGPTTRGFDYYFGVDLPNYPPYCFIENDRTIGIPNVVACPEFNRPGPMLPDWDCVDVLPELTRRAVRYIEETVKAEPAKPFFLYFPLTSPHYPVVPAPEFRGKSGAGDYGDFVVQTDWTVGQVLTALQRAGVAENTLVIFTSDNGPDTTGELNPGVYDRAQRYKHYSMGDLRGAKRDAWEGGHRVPFLVRWPGHVKAGAVSDETICQLDLMATVAAMLGAKLPDNAAEDSYNVLPVWLGEPLAHPVREAAVHSADIMAIRKGDWVFIDAPSGDCNLDPDPEHEPEWFKRERGYRPHSFPGELFNLKEDPAERYNLYGDRPDKVGELKELLDKYRRDGRSTPGTPQQNDPGPTPPPPPAPPPRRNQHSHR
jgi:arylsulfatase A